MRDGMSDTFYVGGYWGPRQESVVDCARRLSRFMAMLARVHPLFATWYEKGRSREAALTHQVDPSIERLQGLLRAGQAHRDDEHRSVMSDLGFSVGLWNGQPTEVALTASCGASAAAPGLTSNVVTMDLPEPEGEGLTAYHRDVALGLVRALVIAWQPSWCTYTSDRLRSLYAADPEDVVVGWSTYISDLERARTDSLPTGVTAQWLEGGLLLTIDGDATSVSEESVSAVRSALGRAVHWNSAGRSGTD